jgi:hypothetical protein
VPSFVLLLLIGAFVTKMSGQGGTLDPAFEKIDFDRWLVERHQARLHLTASVARAELSFHQRLVSRVQVELDGRDLAARRGDGKLMMFIQITDRAGVRYQSHGSIELSQLNENTQTTILDYLQRAFFLPGDYRLAVAILDTTTGERRTRQMQFGVDPPQDEVLPDAWRDLPSVEFIGRESSPDSWYLPGIHGRLHWDASLHSPARVNIVLNVAPSVPQGSRPTPSGGLAALLPTLKVLSQIGSSSLSESVELLDLARLRAPFHQNEVQDLDWPELKRSLGEANTASIDVHSLAERHHNAQFFVSEVRRLLRASDKPSVLVILTPSVAFEPGEDLEPVSREGLPACSVVYIRYHAAVWRRGSRILSPMRRVSPLQDVVDPLEGTLEPLRPEVFDVETPEQIRRALAEIERIVLAYGEQSPH